MRDKASSRLPDVAALPVAATLDGGEPCDDRAQQYRRGDRKRRNDRAASGSRDRGFGIGDHGVDTALGIRASQAGNPANKLQQISAVFGRDATMARGRQ